MDQIFSQIESDCRNHTILSHAAKSRNITLVKYLINHLVDVSNNILIDAVKSNCVDIVKTIFIYSIRFSYITKNQILDQKKTVSTIIRNGQICYYNISVLSFIIEFEKCIEYFNIQNYPLDTQEYFLNIYFL